MTQPSSKRLVTEASLAAATTALSATYARAPLPALELVSMTAFGDSYANGGAGSTNGARYWDRIASRNRTKALVNRGVSGTRSDQILSAIVTNWTPNQQGLIGLGDIVINDLRQWVTDTDKATTRECFRSMLARLNAWTVQDSTATSLAYGPGWTSGLSDGAAGRYADVAWTGPTANIRVGCVTTAGATVTVKDATGATVATFATGGYKVAFEGVIRLAGYGAGNHTVRVTVDAAATIAGVIVPMPAPPVIVWFKPGPYTDTGSVQQNRLALYLAECATILAGNAYPNVIPVDVDAGWDNTTMIYAADGLHPNDKGHAYIADRIQTALLAQGFTQGLNAITSTDAGTYTAPTPSYTGPGATAPTAPTGVAATSANQMVVTWTPGADGGATLTGQAVQASSDSGTSWATVATAAVGASSATISSGLTEATSYVFRVGATNSVGTTYSTASTAAVAGAPPATYASDDFTRADAATLGSTPVGGYTWALSNATAAIVSNRAVLTEVTSGFSEAAIDDAHANGTIQLELRTPVLSNGMLFRSSGLTDGYLIWYDGSNARYNISRRDGAGTYTLLANTTGVTPAVGDVVKAVCNGSSVKCYVNGTLFHTFTDATNVTKTRHGMLKTSGAARTYDNFIHTSLTV